jgi:hypothetical protein
MKKHDSVPSAPSENAGISRRELAEKAVGIAAVAAVGTSAFATSASAQATFSPMMATHPMGAGRFAMVPQGAASVLRASQQTFDVYIGKPAGSSTVTAFVALPGANTAALQKSLGSPVQATISNGVLRIGGLAAGAASRSAGAMKEISAEAGAMRGQ